MKKLICGLLIVLYLASMFPVNVYAVPSQNQSDNSNLILVRIFEDGSTITSRIVNKPSPNRLVKAGACIYTYENALGTVQWEATLEATFTYTGIVAVCTSSSLSFSIYSNNWSVHNQSAYRNGDTAYGDFDMYYTLLGIVMSELPVQMTLTCDPDGNLS